MYYSDLETYEKNSKPFERNWRVFSSVTYQKIFLILDITALTPMLNNIEKGRIIPTIVNIIDKLILRQF